MYECDGQMSLFDFMDSPKQQDKSIEIDCDTCGYDIKGSCNYLQTKDDYCVLGNKWIPKTEVLCKFSKHKCNKENIWNVADTLTDKPSCPHICCRQCDIKGCGARCNGAGGEYDVQSME